MAQKNIFDELLKPKRKVETIDMPLDSLDEPLPPVAGAQVYAVPGQTVIEMPPDALGSANTPGFKATQLAEDPLETSPPLVSIPPATKRATQRKSADPADAKRAVAQAQSQSPESVDDSILKDYKDKASGLQNDRMAALEKAAGEKDLTDGEKVAMALLGALPGLLGAGLGGAIAGGWGAAAGAAGGLQGGAKGMESIVAGKESRRKEAKGDADKILEQIMAMEGQSTRRQELLEGRGIDDKKTRDAMQLQRELTQLRESGDDRRTRATVGAQLASAEIGAKSRDYNAVLDYMAKRDKAAADASAGRKPTEHQLKLAQLYPQMAMATETMNAIDKEGAPQANTASNAYNTIVPRTLESKQWREYRDAATSFAQHYTFSVSGAQAPEAEVERVAQVFATKPSDSTEQVAMKMRMRDAANSIVLDVAEGRISPGDAARKAAEIGLPTMGQGVRPVDAAATTKQRYGF